MVWAVIDREGWRLLCARCRPLFPSVFHPHVTLAYRVTRAEYQRRWPNAIGWTGMVRVTGCAANDRVQAAVVDLTAAPIVAVRGRPHITIWAAPGVQPVESNDMLAGPHRLGELSPPLDLEARVEFVPFGDQPAPYDT